MNIKLKLQYHLIIVFNSPILKIYSIKFDLFRSYCCLAVFSIRMFHIFDVVTVAEKNKIRRNQTSNHTEQLENLRNKYEQKMEG